MSIMGVQTVVTTSRPAQVSELPSDWPANCTMWWGDVALWPLSGIFSNIMRMENSKTRQEQLHRV